MNSGATANIYHMLTYIYPPLAGSSYARTLDGRVDNPADLLAALMAAGVSAQLKHGLHRQYTAYNEELGTVRGRIDMRATMALGYRRSNRVFCEYDALSEDNPANRVIKEAMQLLLANQAVQPERRRRVKRLMPYFAGVQASPVSTASPVSDASLKSVAVSSLNRAEGSETPEGRVLQGMSRFVHHLRQGGGAALDDESMQRIFCGYVLDYYRKHHGSYMPESKQIKWEADHTDMLPTMGGNILLHNHGKTLLIDPRFYRRSTLRACAREGERGGKSSMHGENIYRLFTRVTNLDAGAGEVCGLLLYGREDGEPIPDAEYNMRGIRIVVRSVNLRGYFRRVCRQLDGYIISGMK